MNKQIGPTTVQGAAPYPRGVGVPLDMDGLALQGVAASRELYTRTALAAHENTKLLTELAEAAWGSTKMLRDKLVQNAATNTEAGFAMAQAIATAKSLPEIAMLQSQYMQKLAGQTADQAKEFLDLSARATQHVLERAQSAMMRAITPPL
jgi:hypothetical protein